MGEGAAWAAGGLGVALVVLVWGVVAAARASRAMARQRDGAVDWFFTELARPRAALDLRLALLPGPVAVLDTVPLPAPKESPLAHVPSPVAPSPPSREPGWPERRAVRAVQPVGWP